MVVGQLAGCGGCNNEPTDTVAARCVSFESLFVDEDAVYLAVGGCRAGLSFTSFVLHAEGDLSLTLCTDNTILVPEISAGAQGGRVDRMVWRGSWWSVGIEPKTIWR